MQPDQKDSTQLEALVETIQKDVSALKAGDPTARTRLVDSSAQLQRAVETPAERTFKMRFAASFLFRTLFEPISFFSFFPCLFRGKNSFDFLYKIVPPTVRDPYLHRGRRVRNSMYQRRSANHRRRAFEGCGREQALDWCVYLLHDSGLGPPCRRQNFSPRKQHGSCDYSPPWAS